MRLAEALILRADVQKRYNQVKARLNASAKVQEGEQPPEQPEALLHELEQLLKEQGMLVRRINRTNAETVFDEQRTIADALADRDLLAQHRNALTELIQAASVRQDRFTRTEIRYMSTVDIAALQRQADQLARDYRALDIRLQEMNWSTDLVEE
ncbi:DIP1984 family protein [Paenibacillus campi]|uniref:DIP1984 family protein n=1 Tax=Paenibacillus campi TaxID=3106031 RepID=UPI002AFDFFF0|nr:DIP1984 family protein [Paenibacillus sp. SGZ-1009]